jgi:5-methylcytosine-specific restriction endonuclease McrA
MNPMNGFSYIADDEEIKREKNKARALRATQWWKRKRAKGICFYCKRKFPARELTMDHIVPVSKGGKSTKNNVVPCCKTCNSEKKSRLLMDWQPAADRENPD